MSKWLFFFSFPFGKDAFAGPIIYRPDSEENWWPESAVALQAEGLLVNTTFYELHIEGNEEKYQMPVEALELEGLAQWDGFQIDQQFW